MKQITNLFAFIGIVFLITNIALSIVLVSFALRSVKERQLTHKTVETFECILLIRPEERTREKIDRCQDEANMEK